MITQNKFPPGWDEARVQSVIAHCEQQTEDEVVAEDEAAFQDEDSTFLGLLDVRTALQSRQMPNAHLALIWMNAKRASTSLIYGFPTSTQHTEVSVFDYQIHVMLSKYYKYYDALLAEAISILVLICYSV